MALSNSQYNAIMREYERLQAESRSELRARKEKIYAAVPELRALELKAGSSAMERFRAAVKTGNRAAVEGFSGELRDLEAERRRLLAEAGYPADALEWRTVSAATVSMPGQRSFSTASPASGGSWSMKTLTDSLWNCMMISVSSRRSA